MGPSGIRGRSGVGFRTCEDSEVGCSMLGKERNKIREKKKEMKEKKNKKKV